VIGYAKALALEVGKHNITVNPLMSGLFGTPLLGRTLDRQPEMSKAGLGSGLPGRIGEPHEFADLVATLVSPHLTFVTGVVPHRRRIQHRDERELENPVHLGMRFLVHTPHDTINWPAKVTMCACGAKRRRRTGATGGCLQADLAQSTNDASVTAASQAVAVFSYSAAMPWKPLPFPPTALTWTGPSAARTIAGISW
jgi:hypothetical protein